MPSSSQSTGTNYSDAGVNIEKAGNLFNSVYDKLAATKRPEVLSPRGAFGGMFQLDLSRYSQPVIVSSIDGVGTKLMVAEMMKQYESVGHDIVNHCINDIAVQGAEPLFFMDYLGTGTLKDDVYTQVLSGIADACKAHNVSVLGGETAEMPGMYGEHFDLVGTIFGVVEKDAIITGAGISEGDVIIGLQSNGLHTNGYSLARKVLFETGELTVSSPLEGSEDTIGSALLKPHTCYWPVIDTLLKNRINVKGISHITGGGWEDNMKRILPNNIDLVCQKSAMSVPPIMHLIQKLGNVAENEMYRAFNMGLGMALIVSEAECDQALSLCQDTGIVASVAGHTKPGSGCIDIID
jgi:phosphoribosylformylglycinamidine cyclo-ligase